MCLPDREKPHYGFLDELQNLPGRDPDAQGLISITERSLSLYRPEEEAVVIKSREEGIYVLIIGRDRTKSLEEILWTKPTWRDAGKNPSLVADRRGVRRGTAPILGC